MEVSDVRRRLRQAMDRARRASAERRVRADAAAVSYERFLSAVATPVFRMMATALKAEGHPFTVFTPAGSLRLSSDRTPEDFIELALDTAADPPVVVTRVSRARGHRVTSIERPLRDDQPIEKLSEEDVLEFLLSEILPFLVK